MTLISSTPHSMSLESLFTRLALRPSTVCRQFRRGMATAPPREPRGPATATLPERASQPARTPDRSQARRNSFDIATKAINESTAKSSLYQQSQAQRDLERGYNATDLSRQVSRRWKVGDVYAPHDLSGAEMAKWKKQRRKPRPKVDVLDQLALNPLHHYKNFSIMSEYITEMGRIKHSNETGLRPVNQRKMAKAIRRAMGMGLMPGVHRHPMLLKHEKKI